MTDKLPDQPAPEPEPKGVRRARWRGRFARITGALAVLGLTAVVTAAGFAAPIPADVAVESLSVDVPPAAQSLVCAGALTLPEGAGVGSDSAFDPTPVDTLTEVRALSVAAGAATDDGTEEGAAPSGTLTPLAGGAAVGTLGPEGSAVQTLRASGVPDATLLRAEPVGDVPPRAAAAAASITTAGDLRGLSAASCQPPSANQWLVGGSTELGSSALLVVANPGATAAEVSVEVFGPSGQIDLAGSAQFLVAPGAERALLLEGVAAEQKRLAVHVSAAGGLITAHVQDSRLNGFTPAGVDLVSAGAAPSTRQVVGGLLVPASAIEDTDAALLRLLAPGTAGTTARISLLGPAGIVTLPGADTVELAAGEVTDVPLGGLAAGAYSVVVDSDEPVVAGAMISRPGLPGELDDVPTLERAWSASSLPGVGGAVALPARVDGTVLITGVGIEADGSGGGAAVGTLRVLGVDGTVLNDLEMSVPAGTTVAIPVASLAGGATVAGLDLAEPETAGAGGSGTDATPSGDAVLAWSLLGTVAAADGEFVSILAPVPAATEPPSVTVRQARALGLP